MIKLFINLKVCWSVLHYHVTCGSFSDLFQSLLQGPTQIVLYFTFKELYATAWVSAAPLREGTGAYFNDFLHSVKYFL